MRQSGTKPPYAQPNPVVNYGKTKKRKKPEPQETQEPLEQKIPIVDENISLPVNDLGLLRALILANQTKDDNLWHTRRSIVDTRVSKEKDYIPLSDLVYEVRKENGAITVSRTVDDWRIRRHRDKRIIHIRSGETFDAGAFIPETRLFNQELDISNVRIPNNFVAYLRDLKGLAKKMAEGGDWQNNAREETERIAGFRRDYESRLESLRDPLGTVPLVDLKRRVEEEIVLRDIVGSTKEGNQRIKFGFEGKV